MDKTTAQTSIKKLYTELFSLSPSAIVTLFEIDISDISFKRTSTNESHQEVQGSTIFRFHNNVKLLNTSIIWRGQEYAAAPISADGFETTAKGVSPTPRLSMSVSDDGIPYLGMLKDRIRELGDIVGGKVTRIRTMAKFLDEANYINLTPPAGFDPDPNAELPRDVYFIEKKNIENKNTIEYLLSSLFDLEGVNIPLRRVMANYCPFSYRGEGCLYEYSLRREETEHGTSQQSTLPEFAPPIANANDELISQIVTGVSFPDFGEYNNDIEYQKGYTVFTKNKNINYYYVAKTTTKSNPPPNPIFWEADQCSKKVLGCALRFGSDGAMNGNIQKGNLRFGGFPSVNRN